MLAQLYVEDEELASKPVYARGFDTVVTLGHLRSSPGFQVAESALARAQKKYQNSLKYTKNYQNAL